MFYMFYMYMSDVTSPKIRVAQILLGDQIWGVERYCINLIEGLKSLGVETLCLCLQEGDLAQALRTLGCDVRIVPIRNYCDLLGCLRLVNIVKEWSGNLIHVHLGVDSFWGAVIGRITAIPVVASVHFDTPAYMLRGWFIREPWRYIQGIKNMGIDYFLAVSTGVAQALAAREQVPLKKISIVRPGIVCKAELPAENRMARRRELELLSDDYLVITVSRLSREKGIDLLIEAAAQIVAVQPKVKFWIIGDGPERLDLEQRAQALQLTDKLYFLGYRYDVGQLLPLADVFVLPSREEPFGIAILEAMSAGLPVIATKTSGPSEIVVPGETGILVPTEEVRPLVQAIERLTFNTQERRLMGQKGLSRSKEVFSVEQMATAVFDVYKECLSGITRAKRRT